MLAQLILKRDIRSSGFLSSLIKFLYYAISLLFFFINMLLLNKICCYSYTCHITFFIAVISFSYEKKLQFVYNSFILIISYDFHASIVQCENVFLNKQSCDSFWFFNSTIRTRFIIDYKNVMYVPICALHPSLLYVLHPFC